MANYLNSDFSTVYLLKNYRNFVKFYEVLSDKETGDKLASFKTTLSSACFANCKLAADKQTVLE